MTDLDVCPLIRKSQIFCIIQYELFVLYLLPLREVAASSPSCGNTLKISLVLTERKKTFPPKNVFIKII